MKKIILAFMVFAMSLSAIAADNDSTKVSKKQLHHLTALALVCKQVQAFAPKVIIHFSLTIAIAMKS